MCVSSTTYRDACVYVRGMALERSLDKLCGHLCADVRIHRCS